MYNAQGREKKGIYYNRKSEIYTFKVHNSTIKTNDQHIYTAVHTYTFLFYLFLPHEVADVVCILLQLQPV